MDPPYRFLRVLSHYKHFFNPFLLSGVGMLSLFLIASCTGEQLQQGRDTETADPGLENNPVVAGQDLPPDNIKSIQVYRGNRKESIPAIELGSDDFITLRFDEIEESSRMFRIRIRHRNADWSPSNLMQDHYLVGYREDFISGGEPSGVQDPSYTHYRYRFPNESMRVRISGNYLIEVLEYESSRKLFSLPFFVYDNQGQLAFNLEEIYGMDSRYLLHHQPFVRYQYPSDIISPTTDLRVFFVKNRFWGRAREADMEDMSESGVYRSYLSRPQAFVGIYEFRPLDMRRYDTPRREVVEVWTETVPPKVHLFRDVVNLDVNPRRRTPAIHGSPRDDHRARYINVRFELELPDREATELPVYVYGPFNNWTIDERHRMKYNSSTDSYVGWALIKEGEYDYKYAVVVDSRIDDLRLDASFASSSQEYISFVYFRDPRWQSDRLLQIRSDRTH